MKRFLRWMLSQIGEWAYDGMTPTRSKMELSHEERVAIKQIVHSPQWYSLCARWDMEKRRIAEMSVFSSKRERMAGRFEGIQIAQTCLERVANEIVAHDDEKWQTRNVSRPPAAASF